MLRYPAVWRAMFRGRGQAGGGSKLPEFGLDFIVLSETPMHPQGVRRIVDAARDRRTPLLLSSKERQ